MLLFAREEEGGGGRPLTCNNLQHESVFEFTDKKGLRGRKEGMEGHVPWLVH